MESIFGLSDEVSREELMIVKVVDWVKLLWRHIFLHSTILESRYLQLENSDLKKHLPDDFHLTPGCKSLSHHPVPRFHHHQSCHHVLLEMKIHEFMIEDQIFHNQITNVQTREKQEALRKKNEELNKRIHE